MNAEIRQIRTVAEQGLSDAFSRVKASLPGNGPVAAMREKAFTEFEARGLPHRRVEEWKYTDLRALMREAKPLAAPPDKNAKARASVAGQFLAGVKARRIVIADGVLVPDLSDLASLEKGLTVRALSEALARGDAETLEMLGKVLPMPGDAAVALNTAFMGDGAVVHVAPGAKIERPIHLAFITTASSGTSAFARSLIVAGKGAQVTVLESHEGPDGVDYQVNHALEFSIAGGARVDHIKIVREGDKALHVGTLMKDVGAGATVNDFTFTIGGAVVRNQIAIRFGGEHVNANISGASLLRKRQHADNTMVIDHAVPHCTSREIFKSVLDDEARSVFQGKIIVRPHAQKTDGKMATHALLLSETAEADAKPELEIFADDVVCGHGATAGALDDELLFYLKARGIPQKEAEALMVQAFVGEAAEAIPNEAVREALMDEALRWLAVRD